MSVKVWQVLGLAGRKTETPGECPKLSVRMIRYGIAEIHNSGQVFQIGSRGYILGVNACQPAVNNACILTEKLAEYLVARNAGASAGG